jgi:hypothetical protein
MGAASHGVGDISPDGCACPGEIFDRLARTGARQVILV